VLHSLRAKAPISQLLTVYSSKERLNTNLFGDPLLKGGKTVLNPPHFGDGALFVLRPFFKLPGAEPREMFFLTLLTNLYGPFSGAPTRIKGSSWYNPAQKFPWGIKFDPIPLTPLL